MINYQTQATRDANNKEAARIMAEHGHKVPVGGATSIKDPGEKRADMLAARKAG